MIQPMIRAFVKLFSKNFGMSSIAQRGFLSKSSTESHAWESLPNWKQVFKRLSTRVHTARLAAAKRWKQPKCSSASEGINRMWSIHALEYYSATKKSEVPTGAALGMDPEPMVEATRV